MAAVGADRELVVPARCRRSRLAVLTARLVDVAPEATANWSPARSSRRRAATGAAGAAGDSEMARRGGGVRTPSYLPSSPGYVAAGVMELIARQKEGYAYIWP